MKIGKSRIARVNVKNICKLKATLSDCGKVRESRIKKIEILNE